MAKGMHSSYTRQILMMHRNFSNRNICVNLFQHYCFGGTKSLTETVMSQCLFPAHNVDKLQVNLLAPWTHFTITERKKNDLKSHCEI